MPIATPQRPLWLDEDKVSFLDKRTEQNLLFFFFFFTVRVLH